MRIASLAALLTLSVGGPAILASGGGGAGAFAPLPADLLRVPPDSTELVLEGVHVKHAAEDARGTLWAATMEQGLARRERGAKEWTFLNQASGALPEDSVSRVIVFRDAVWLGFATSGVGRLDGGRLVRFTAAGGQLPGDEVAELVDWQGRLWVVTDRGLASTDGAGFRPAAGGAAGFPHGQITAASAGADGKLWLGTDETELGSFDGTSWSSLAFKGRIAGRIIRCIHATREDVWFGTLGSLDRYWWGTNRLDDETNERPALFPSRVITAIASTPGGLLIGTDGGGLYRLELPGHAWHVYNETNGLPSSTVNSVTVRDKTALVATPGGLVRIDLSR